MSEINGERLDEHITGNFGEAQFVDESEKRGRGICRACHLMKPDVLADNGYCSDCD